MKNINCAIALLIAVFSGLMLSCSESSERSPAAYVIPEVTAVDNINISGVSQKGPFVNGSSVTVQELEGTTLAQTGKSFKGKIANDRGEFSISSVSLVSQYALLEANGYYRNEVTGNKSTSTITLNAITDLSNRSSVNINILTHLEYSRVLFLIDNDSINMAAAKAQAEDEIMKAFGIDSISSLSEDLSIFSNGSSDAALLALSVLFQGNKTEAELSEVLANFSNDIEEDGSWDDEQTKASMADWAVDADLASIKTNILSWGVSDTVPDFESDVYSFWSSQYNLGECDSANSLEVKQADNAYSANNEVHFLCTENVWRKASNLEYDNYGVVCALDGSIQEGLVSHLPYVCDSSIFRVALGLEDTLNKGCTSYNIGDTASHGTDFYVCADSGWYLASVFQYKTFGLTCANDGSIQASLTVPTLSYVCDSLAFRSPNNSETRVGKGCTSFNRNDSTGQYIATDGTYYGYSICGDSAWKEMTYNDSLTDERDGKVYRTVGIGKQMWMAENLDYDTLHLEQSFCPDSSGAMMLIIDTASVRQQGDCEHYGRLYTWAAAMSIDSIFNDSVYSTTGTHKGVCPIGWHLPSTAEWETLSSYVGGHLKCTGSSSYCSMRTSLAVADWVYPVASDPIVGLDDFGFAALPAGYATKIDAGRSTTGVFLYAAQTSDMSNHAFFWATDDKGKLRTIHAAGVDLSLSSFETTMIAELYKKRARSVRCLKDQ